MKQLLILLFITFTGNCLANSSDSLKILADSAYSVENYDKAIMLYKKAAPSADVCYNLGNSYYRKDEIAQAVLWYERAHILSPGDEDIRFNLNMARSKTIDKIVPRHQIFLAEWWNSISSIMSVDSWARMSLVFFAICLIALGIYIYALPLWLRKTGFGVFVVFFLLCIVSNLCAIAGRTKLIDRNSAIVMSPSAVVKSTPSESGNDLFVLHEGTRVEIRDNTLNEWAEVELSDGKIGWIEKKLIEII